MKEPSDHIETRAELMTRFRNSVAYRQMSFECDAAYWDEISKGEKDNTQGKVDALRNRDSSLDNVRKDDVYLRIIDGLLAKEK